MEILVQLKSWEYNLGPCLQNFCRHRLPQKWEFLKLMTNLQARCNHLETEGTWEGLVGDWDQPPQPPPPEHKPPPLPELLHSLLEELPLVVRAVQVVP